MVNCPDIVIVENLLDEIIIIETVGLPGSGSADKNFIWEQTTNLATWTVPHNLNKKVSPIILDSLGNVVLAEFIYIDLNIIQIQHGTAMTGSVICN
jgi:hypothetical protein